MESVKPFVRPVVLVVAGCLIGWLLVGPVGAHVPDKFGHLWQVHIKPKLGEPGTINSAKNPVDWTKLKNVPEGFADGIDDVGGGGDTSGLQARVTGDCSSVGPPGAGITAVNSDGSVVCDPDDVGLDAVEVVGETSVTDSAPVKSVTATCPPGKIAIGGGADVNQEGTEVSLTSSEPKGGAVVGPEWRATAFETVDTDLNWFLRAYAVCVAQ
jgi:hypothetical protein